MAVYKSEWQWARNGYRLKSREREFPAGFGRVGQRLYTEYQVYFTGAPQAVEAHRRRFPPRIPVNPWVSRRPVFSY